MIWTDSSGWSWQAQRCDSVCVLLYRLADEEYEDFVREEQTRMNTQRYSPKVNLFIAACLLMILCLSAVLWEEEASLVLT